jgi:hypothetical protein
MFFATRGLYFQLILCFSNPGAQSIEAPEILNTDPFGWPAGGAPANWGSLRHSGAVPENQFGTRRISFTYCLCSCLPNGSFQGLLAVLEDTLPHPLRSIPLPFKFSHRRHSKSKLKIMPLAKP